MEKKKQNIVIASIIVLILFLIIFYAYNECYLGKYSKLGCLKGSFCSNDLTNDSNLIQTQRRSEPISNVIDTIDEFAAHKINRDNAAFASTRDRQQNIRSNPAQITARRARHTSMHEGFSSSSAQISSKNQNNNSYCIHGCIDGCNGTNCTDLCQDLCN